MHPPSVRSAHRTAAPALARPYGIVLSGVGGAGIVTTASVLGMAAHLDGKGCTTLDMMGLAQKGGAVTSHLRVFRDVPRPRAARIPEGAADLVLGCDIMSVAGDEPLSTMARHRSQVIVNTHEIIPGDFTRTPDYEFPSQALRLQIEAAAGAEPSAIWMPRTAKVVAGDPSTTNMLLVGFAFQQGLFPLSRDAIRRAVEINGAAVEANLAAFEAGRQIFCRHAGKPPRPSPGRAAAGARARSRRRPRCADRSAAPPFSPPIRTRPMPAATGNDRDGPCRRGHPGPGSLALTEAVARNLSKLMAYKDEYEVARLHAGEDFRRDLERQFEGPIPVEISSRAAAAGPPRQDHRRTAQNGVRPLDHAALSPAGAPQGPSRHQPRYLWLYRGAAAGATAGGRLRRDHRQAHRRAWSPQSWARRPDRGRCRRRSAALATSSRIIARRRPGRPSCSPAYRRPLVMAAAE